MINEIVLKVYLKIRAVLRSESGQAMTEYGIIVALIALVAIGFIAALGTGLKESFGKILDALGIARP